MNVSLEQIAAFRYSLISGIVNRKTPLLPGEITEYFKEIASRDYIIPGSSRVKVSVRSLERYKHLYEKFGYDGLYPSKRDISTISRSSQKLLKMAEALKREKPERSIEQILYIMENNNLFSDERLSASAISRYFRKIEINGNKLLKENNSERILKRFEAQASNVIWQSDFQHTLYLPDPDKSNKKKKAILCLVLDDYSRYVVHGQFYWDEKIPCIEDSLKKAILKHGKPEQFYCDNGSAFSSSHLQNICARIGIRLSHSRPYTPMGRGKCERIFRFVDTSFKPEAYLAIERGDIKSLEDLNIAFNNWLEGFYHLRIHGSTKETPQQRMERAEKSFLQIDLETFHELFFIEETRTVNKTSCIKLLGNEYEVNSSLRSKKINLRYDPFNLKVIQVWYMGKKYENAKLLELLNPTDDFHTQGRCSKNNKNEEPEKKSFPPISDDDGNKISFFKTLEKNKEKEWEKNCLSYYLSKKEEKSRE
jgi:putative transposase